MRLLAAIVALMVATVSNLVAQSDTLPPLLIGESFASATIDVTSSAQTVTFSLHVTDDLAGINFAQVNLRSPSGGQTSSNFAFSSTVVLDTTLLVPVTVPRYSEPGTWTVASIRLGDRVGNQITLNTAALTAAGYPTALTVLDSTPDTVPPTVGGVAFSPNSVDVSSAAADV